MSPPSTDINSGDAFNPLSGQSFNDELRVLCARLEQASNSGGPVQLSPREVELIQKRLNLSDFGLRTARAILRRSISELREVDDSPTE